MGFLGWMALTGAFLLAIALSSAYIRRLPLSTAAIYLALGVALGPLGAGLVALDVVESAPALERLTEVAVVVSLFIGGLRLRLPLRHPAWSAAWRLASVTMLVSIVGVAAVAHVLVGLDWPLALLLGAILAPTDPVLAGAVTVNDADDHDRMRYGLSGEAGLNDGMAFPFVFFALAFAASGEVASWVGGWALQRVVWGVPAALALGYALGLGFGRVAMLLRTMHRDTAAPSDFFVLALIALSYVAAEAVGALGFLAVFAAGVGLRQAELRVVETSPHPEHAGTAPAGPHTAADAAPEHPPAEQLVPPIVDAAALREPAVAAGVLVFEALSFGDTVERLLEVLVVVAVGVCLAAHWDTRAIPLGLALALLIRPFGAWLALLGSPTTRHQRALMGWFGIRGVGSLYYVAYALAHAPEIARGRELADLVVSVVALSILLHGLTTQPLLARYERVLHRTHPA
jgi:NhaP-type Na+/H+ or K+/H+ antiporter